MKARTVNRSGGLPWSSHRVSLQWLSQFDWNFFIQDHLQFWKITFINTTFDLMEKSLRIGRLLGSWWQTRVFQNSSFMSKPEFYRCQRMPSVIFSWKWQAHFVSFWENVCPVPEVEEPWFVSLSTNNGVVQGEKKQAFGSVITRMLFLERMSEFDI